MNRADIYIAAITGLEKHWSIDRVDTGRAMATLELGPGLD